MRYAIDRGSINATRRLPRLQMWHQILIAMILGLAVGHFVGEPTKMLAPLGDIFMSLIRMCMIPVVFVSLACGITSLSDMAAMRRIAWKSIAIYAVTMAIMVAIAIPPSTVLKRPRRPRASRIR